MGTISLLEAYNDNIEREYIDLKKMNDPKERSFSALFLASVNKVFFLYTLFEEHDYQKSKLFLYKTAMAKAYYYEKYVADAFGAMNTFCFPILSDSQEAIERYLRYPYPGMEPGKVYAKNGFSTHFAQAIQSVIKNDDKSLEVHIEGLRKRSKRGWEKLYAGTAIAFEGILLKNKENVEQGIYDLLKTNKKQRPNSLDYQYINYEATTIAKLAWRRGILVDIDNPLVPKELLPMQELEHYEGYEFFKELDK